PDAGVPQLPDVLQLFPGDRQLEGVRRQIGSTARFLLRATQDAQAVLKLTVFELCPEVPGINRPRRLERVKRLVDVAIDRMGDAEAHVQIRRLRVGHTDGLQLLNVRNKVLWRDRVRVTPWHRRNGAAPGLKPRSGGENEFSGHGLYGVASFGLQ